MSGDGPGRFYPPQGMEMGCIRPGHWMVEGYEVERCQKDGKVWWKVFERHTGENETFHGKRRTLTEACDLIWEMKS